MSNIFKVKTLIAGFKNLWKWLPTIWWDRNFDSTYLDEILYVKLEAMYESFKNSQLTDNLCPEKCRNAIKEMQVCLHILNRRRENWYTTTWYKKCPRSVPYGNIIIMSNDVSDKGSKLLDEFIEIRNRDHKILYKLLERSDTWAL